MRWYVSRYGETVGPVEGPEVIAWIQARVAQDGVFVRDEAASEWISIEKSPFAGIGSSRATLAANSGGSSALAIPPEGSPWSVPILATVVTLCLALAMWVAWSRPTTTVETAVPLQPTKSEPPPLDPAVVAGPFLSEVDRDWAAFDALPAQQRAKPQLQAHLKNQEAIVERTPEAARPLIASHSLTLARQRFSAWSSVGSSAAGENATDLVPSSDKAKCIVWGSMWAGDVDTLSAMMTLGFLRIVCHGKTWILKDEASVCYLWSVDPDDRNAKGAATVWATFELLQRAQVVGRRTDDEGPLALIALMSDDRSTTMVGGVKATITEVGKGWFRVKGENFGGYVPAALCHHTSKK